MILETLRERGFIANVSDEVSLRAQLEQTPVTVYCGYDPSGPSLHVGHLVTLMLLAHFQRAGHRPVALMGGGTGLIGDPSGKSAARTMLSLERVQQNVSAIRGQVGRYLDLGEHGGLLLNNADWLMELSYIPFLRDVGRHFTLNQLMQHETYRERFERDSLSFIELNYALVQAYDFLHLYQAHGCVLQVGGNDQWFNVLAGVELIRRVAGAQAFALTSPLLATSSGQKMGKTETGAIWLDPSLTSPYDYYQYWRNTEDADLGRFLRLFTFLPLAEIAELERGTSAEINGAKERLAFEATALTHGAHLAREAQETARARFGGASNAADKGPAVTVREPTDLLDLLVLAHLAESRSEGKRLLRGGGVRLAGQLQSEARLVQPDELPALLSVGKRRLRLVPA